MDMKYQPPNQSPMNDMLETPRRNCRLSASTMKKNPRALRRGDQTARASLLVKSLKLEYALLQAGA
jgi:hypothetical protein